MEVKDGQTRKVFVFNWFVVKVARINWGAAYRNVAGWWKRGKRKKALQLFLEIFQADNYSTDFHPKTNLLAGIRANLLEFGFYLRHQHIFCKPTYFTFFGLFNIQKKGQMCKMPYEKFKPRMHQLTNQEIPDNDHTFDSPSNFSCDDNHLQVIDYADPIIQPLILKYGQKLYNDFLKA
ncbi:hypothetical protein ACFL2U_03320 [Patescibacteria group bacterium]